MSTIASVSFTTKPQSFPGGTVDGLFSLTLSGPAGFTPVTKTNNAPNAFFDNLTPGAAYSCVCSKNGVQAAAPVTFTMSLPPVTLQVPDVGSVAMS